MIKGGWREVAVFGITAACRNREPERSAPDGAPSAVRVYRVRFYCVRFYYYVD